MRDILFVSKLRTFIISVLQVEFFEHSYYLIDVKKCLDDNNLVPMTCQPMVEW